MAWPAGQQATANSQSTLTRTPATRPIWFCLAQPFRYVRLKHASWIKTYPHLTRRPMVWLGCLSSPRFARRLADGAGLTIGRDLPREPSGSGGSLRFSSETRHQPKRCLVFNLMVILTRLATACAAPTVNDKEPQRSS